MPTDLPAAYAAACDADPGFREKCGGLYYDTKDYPPSWMLKCWEDGRVDIPASLTAKIIVGAYVLSDTDRLRYGCAEEIWSQGAIERTALACCAAVAGGKA